MAVGLFYIIIIILILFLVFAAVDSKLKEIHKATSDLNIKLKNTEEKLQSASKCENNHMLHYNSVVLHCDINCVLFSISNT